MEITHPNYINFSGIESSSEDSKVRTTFIKDFLETDTWSNLLLAKPIIDNFNSNKLKLKIWKAQKDFTSPLYIVIVTCFDDNTMVKLGVDHGILRGFPILYNPSKKIKFFGFKRKFKNVVKQASIPTDFKGAAWFKKFSGFLGQLLTFEHEGNKFWTTCSKNSADSSNTFCNDCARLFEKYITSTLLNNLLINNIHLCAEVMSKNDQIHGAEVLSEMSVVTSMSKGGILNLEDKIAIDFPNKGYITPFGFKETINFCKTNNLKVGSAVICSNKACSYFIKMLHNSCDIMDDNIYEKILETIVAKFPAEIKVISGTMTHQECLGNILEGLVIHSINTIKVISHEQIVDIFENNTICDDTITFDITKYKYPKYTVRTMCIRQSDVIPIENYDEHIKNWAKHWCLTSEGFEYWYNFAWAVKFMILENPSYDSNIGKHITFSDNVLEDGIPVNINEKISKILGNVIKLNGPITVVHPFCENLEPIRILLENQNFHILKTKSPPKHLSGYVNLTKMPTKYSKTSGPIFEVSLSLEKMKELETWQIKKMESKRNPNIIFANNEEDIITRISDFVKENNDASTDCSQEIVETEINLTKSINRCISNINEVLTKYDSENKNAIILLVGIQCIGKSTIFSEIQKMKTNVSQCSADIFMGSEYNPNRIIECHKLCQKAVIESIKNGFHAIVDNTSIIAEHRTIYKKIAQLLDVDLVVFNVCGEYWLNCSKEIQNKTINALELRSNRRQAKTGKTIYRDVIQKAIHNCCEDLKKFTKKNFDKVSNDEVEKWLNHFPRPSFINGLSYFNSNRFQSKSNKVGAFTYSSNKLLNIVDSYLINPEFKIIENINKAILNYYTTRTFGNHITIIDSKEVNYLKSKGLKIPPLADIEFSEDFEVLGLGSVNQGSNSVFYLVINWQWAQDFRKSFGLDYKDLHVTVAFTENDIFDVPKNEKTILF